jgi:hypothetical protein
VCEWDGDKEMDVRRYAEMYSTYVMCPDLLPPVHKHVMPVKSEIEAPAPNPDDEAAAKSKPKAPVQKPKKEGPARVHGRQDPPPRKRRTHWIMTPQK